MHKRKNKKEISWFFCLLAGMFFMGGCGKHAQPVDPKSEIKDSFAAPVITGEHPGQAVLQISLILNKEVYQKTNYGEPPQLAVWLEDPHSGAIQTVWVSYRMGTGRWAGKAECSVCLPFWAGRYHLEMDSIGPPIVR